MQVFHAIKAKLITCSIHLKRLDPFETLHKLLETNFLLINLIKFVNRGPLLANFGPLKSQLQNLFFRIGFNFSYYSAK